LRVEGLCDVAPTPEQTLSTGAVIRCVRPEAELLQLQGWAAGAPVRQTAPN
jgi:hypothetical protein